MRTFLISCLFSFCISTLFVFGVRADPPRILLKTGDPLPPPHGSYRVTEFGPLAATGPGSLAISLRARDASNSSTREFVWGRAAWDIPPEIAASVESPTATCAGLRAGVAVSKTPSWAFAARIDECASITDWPRSGSVSALGLSGGSTDPEFRLLQGSEDPPSTPLSSLPEAASLRYVSRPAMTTQGDLAAVIGLAEYQDVPTRTESLAVQTSGGLFSPRLRGGSPLLDAQGHPFELAHINLVKRFAVVRTFLPGTGYTSHHVDIAAILRTALPAGSELAVLNRGPFTTSSGSFPAATNIIAANGSPLSSIGALPGEQWRSLYDVALSDQSIASPYFLLAGKTSAAFDRNEVVQIRDRIVLRKGDTLPGSGGRSAESFRITGGFRHAVMNASGDAAQIWFDLRLSRSWLIVNNQVLLTSGDALPPVDLAGTGEPEPVTIQAL